MGASHRVRGLLLRAAVVPAAVLFGSAACLAGDAAKAKRDLNYAKMSLESERWDDLDGQLKKVEGDLEGLGDAEKAPVLAELATVKATASKAIENEITARLDKAAKSLADSPQMADLDLKQAARRLDSDDAKSFLDPTAAQKLRARLASMDKSAPAAPPETIAPVRPRTPDAPLTPLAPRTPDGTGGPAVVNVPKVPEMFRTPDAPKAPDAVSPAHADEVEQAKRDMKWVKMAVEDQLWEKVAERVHKVEADLANVPDAEKASIVADLAGYQKQAQAKVNADAAEQINQSITRILDGADRFEAAGDKFGFDTELQKATELLNSEQAKGAFDAGGLEFQRGRIEALRQAAPGRAKARAMARVAPAMKELETRLAADPFKGAEASQAQRTYAELDALLLRINGPLSSLPQDDPEVKAAVAKAAALKARLDAGSEAWGQATVEAAVADAWKRTQAGVAGWEQEAAPAGAGVTSDELLPKTQRAVHDLSYWLAGDPWVRGNRQKYKDAAAIVAADAEARQALDAALAKLAAAYDKALSAMEQMPAPRDQYARFRPARLGQNAGQWFEGTKYQQAAVARGKALTEKWEADLEAQRKAGEALTAKLVAEAAAAWPAIDAAAKGDTGFDPNDLGNWKGRTVKLKGVYNRSGWDFPGVDWDFTVKVNGTPVAGNYAPNVRKAFDEALRKSPMGVDEHLPWDVIAVVEGPGRCRERTIREIRINDGPEKIKLESNEPRDCVVVRIIGLHAGPVAVGP